MNIFNTKKLTKLGITLLLSLLLALPAVCALFYYTHPMNDLFYDLLIYGDDGEEWNGNEGWTFYTNEAGKVTELTADGFGGYLGLDYPGQTFYYSIKLSHELDAPALQIGTVNRNISIFLDNEMIYTDCPELDNRIGYLNLPMLDYDRQNPCTVTLPPDYLGRTLTIAQSTSALSEKQTSTDAVWPCSVTLYCGFAYESCLIAASSSIMLRAALLFALEILLLATFIWKTCIGNFSLKLPVFALTVLFCLCNVLAQADFFNSYFETPLVDPQWTCFHLSLGALLLFLSLYATGLRPFYVTVTILQWSSTLLFFLTQAGLLTEYGELYVFLTDLPKLTGFFSLLIVLCGGFYLRRKGNPFFLHMTQAVLVLVIGYGLFFLASMTVSGDYAASVISRIKAEIKILLPNFTLRLVWYLSLFSSLWAVLIELATNVTQYFTENAILSAQNELALESYENLQHQSEEIMMIRHDVMKHYSLLRTMAKVSPERVSGYLDELIGEAENIRPVVSTPNRMLNILLNGKLNAATAKGISVEVARCDAPKKLPLTNNEACSLFLNILDNAIKAAADSRVENPYIHLDLHCKNHHFVFSCENSMSDEIQQQKKYPLSKHGYGLKIIHRIMKHWGANMVSIEHSEGIYKITILIPL